MNKNIRTVFAVSIAAILSMGMVSITGIPQAFADDDDDEEDFKKKFPKKPHLLQIVE